MSKRKTTKQKQSTDQDWLNAYFNHVRENKELTLDDKLKAKAIIKMDKSAHR